MVSLGLDAVFVCMKHIYGENRLLQKREFFRFCGALVFAGSVASLGSCGGAKQNSALQQQANRIVARTEIPVGARRADLLRLCASLSKRGFPYVFGGESPAEGGMDCSGTIHYLLVQLGYRYPPRQSNHQYLWCKQAGKFHSWKGGSLPRNIRSGDLLFWKNTYRTGNRYPADISHVMVFMGQDTTGKCWQFGGRGSSARGENGAGIDFHVFQPDKGPFGRGELVGWAQIPGLQS